MRRMIATLVLGGALVAVMSGTPAGATPPPTLPFGPSFFGPGPLTCGSKTYIVFTQGFGAAFRVVDSTTVLVFRAFGPLPPASPPAGLKLFHCTGDIQDSLGNIDHFDV